MPIVWTKPTGEVRVMTLSKKYIAENNLEGESVSDTVMRLAPLEQVKNADLADATFTLIRSSNMPTDRTQRHKWRLSGDTCVVDNSIPDKPHPKQKLLDKIAGATTIEKLKAELLNAIRTGSL